MRRTPAGTTARRASARGNPGKTSATKRGSPPGRCGAPRSASRVRRQAMSAGSRIHAIQTALRASIRPRSGASRAPEGKWRVTTCGAYTMLQPRPARSSASSDSSAPMNSGGQ